MLARVACCNGASSLSVLRVVRPWDRLRVMAAGGPRSACASTSLAPSTIKLALGRALSTSTPAHSSSPAPSALFAPSSPRRLRVAVSSTPSNCPRCSSVFTTALARTPQSLRQLRKLNPAMSAIQTRSHAGHSHGHGHHHHHTDPTLLLSKDKNDAAVRITRLGLYLNVVLAIGKGIAGYYWNSKMLIGDAFHSLSDMVSDIMTLITVKWALRPPSERYPTGFGKIECLGSLGVSSILLLGGLGIGWSAMLTLSQMFAPELADALAHFDFLGLGHGHDHGHGDHGHSHSAIDMAAAVPSLNAAWLLIASAGVKEWLVYATRKVARERKSSVLFSNAMHHRIDSFTAILTAAIIMASNFATNAAWLDPVGSLIITGMVVKAGYENLFQAFSELIDVSIDDEIKSSVRRATSKALTDAGMYSESSDANAVQIKNVGGLKSGPNYLLELELAVPASWTIEQTNGVEDLVRARVGAKVRGAKCVKIRFVAADRERDGPDFLDEFIPSDVSAKSSPGDHEEHDHHHEHEHTHEHKANGGVTKRR
ncbi:Mitochondrial metal transporter 1 [Botryosphaeria dothidea]|uniref:Mitochondrial metal transporter 1 n=1 Tax=Botryosphaeria dothidea TaxID=55169 RepID=A0A8H4IK42_9PEZI|nr:Mitochondrial metal transporter 1 [Botryosphaeria dothidea]